MYLKHSTDYIDSKYIWVHGSNSLGFFVAEIPFLAIFFFWPYTGKGRGVAKWDPAQVNPKLKLHVLSFRFVSPRDFLAKIPFFGLFLVTMVIISRNF